MGDIANVFKKMTDGFNQMGDFFRKIEDLLGSFGKGMATVNRGMGEQGVAMAEAWYDYEMDQGYLLLYTAEFLYTNLICFFYFLGNSFSLDCAVWYVVRLIFCIIYGLTFGIVFIIIKLITGMDLEKTLWSNIYFLESSFWF
jgi:hypothetical protein